MSKANKSAFRHLKKSLEATTKQTDKTEIQLNKNNEQKKNPTKNLTKIHMKRNERNLNNVPT